MFVIVVNYSKYDVHEDVEIDYNVQDEEKCKPLAFIICWHPVKCKTGDSGILRI